MDLSAWTPYAEAMSAFHRGDRDVHMVVYDDYERDEVPLTYFFRDSHEFPELERLALDLCRGRVLDVGAGSGSTPSRCRSVDFRSPRSRSCRRWWTF